jgi:S1-C subfamily serine protease
VVSRRVGTRVAVGVVALTICLCLLVLVTPGGEAGPASHPLDAQQAAAIAEGASGATVTVSGEGCGHSVAGTGFLVEGRVVTNRHLVVDAEVVRVDGLAVRSQALEPTVTVAADIDLAVIPAEGVYGDGAEAPEGGTVDQASSSVTGLTLAGADAPVGAEVVMVGRGDGQRRWQRGRVHLYTTGGPYGATGTVMLIDPAASFGYSGGPVLDGDGRVVGILRAMDLSTGLAIAIPVSDLSSWLYNDVDMPASTSCMGAD